MKNLRTIALVAVIACTVFANTALAVPTIGVYFGDNMSSYQQIKPNTPFDIHVVVTDVDNNVDGVEFAINLPIGLIVQSTAYNGASPVVFGSRSQGLYLGFGECVSLFNAGTQTEYTVATFTCYAFQMFGTAEITLTEATGGGTVQNATPVFSDCNGNLAALTPASGTVETVTVPVESSSFGAVKALY